MRTCAAFLTTTTLLLTLGLVLSGCKKKETEDPAPASNNNGGGGGGGSTEEEGETNPGESKVRFWTTFDFFDATVCYLDFDGHHRLFDVVHYDGWSPSNCSSSENGNFTVEPGTYDYHLDSYTNAGVEWNGTVTVGEDECILVEIAEPADWWGKGKLFVYAEHLTGVDMEVRIEEIYPGPGGDGNLEEAFSNPPALFSEGTFTRYLSPGHYTLQVYDGDWTDPTFLGNVEVEIDAHEVTIVSLYEP